MGTVRFQEQVRCKCPVLQKKLDILRTAIPSVEQTHVTLCLDHAGCRAAAYVALSRVQKDEACLIAGLVGIKHFVPAH